MYNTIISKINEILDACEKETIIIAIDGPSAGGKSYLAGVIKDNFCCNVFHMDDFFLTPDLRTSQRLAEIGGNVDYDRFADQVLENIVHKNNFTYDIFDCHTLSKFSSGTVFNKRLNIVEGVYSMHPTLIEYYDYKIYLSVESDIQEQRILARSSEFLLNRYKNEWIPMENKYFEKLDIKDKCDITFDTSELF